MIYEVWKSCTYSSQMRLLGETPYTGWTKKKSVLKKRKSAMVGFFWKKIHDQKNKKVSKKYIETLYILNFCLGGDKLEELYLSFSNFSALRCQQGVI